MRWMSVYVMNLTHFPKRGRDSGCDDKKYFDFWVNLRENKILPVIL